jgi:predicted transcriptional regulator|nr:MAG TPA: hypothetical protein [Caudoviricetes sp.]
MCKYKISVEMKYGKCNIEGTDDYNMAIEKYKEIKEDFKNTPATITLYNTEKQIEQFTTKTKLDCNFDKLYNELIDVLIRINEASAKMTELEKQYNQAKNKSYHDIEMMDIDELNEDVLFDLKKQLTQRRVTEEGNRCFYSFHNANVKIIEILKDFKESRASKLHEGTNKAYRQPYYKEHENTKRKRITILKDLKINS